jgi:hypothetical protein
LACTAMAISDHRGKVLADDAGAAPPSDALPHQQRSPLGTISDGRQASPRLAGAEQWFRLSPGTITTIQRQKCQY